MGTWRRKDRLGFLGFVCWLVGCFLQGITSNVFPRQQEVKLSIEFANRLNYCHISRNICIFLTNVSKLQVVIPLQTLFSEQHKCYCRIVDEMLAAIYLGVNRISLERSEDSSPLCGGVETLNLRANSLKIA